MVVRVKANLDLDEKADEIRRRIDEIREGTEDLPSITAAVMESHEKEDEPQI